MMSRIFFSSFHARNAAGENIFLHFTTELKIRHFFIRHMRFWTMLILAVCSNDLAHLGVFVARLESMRARRSEVRLLMTQHFFFVPYL